MNLRRVAPLVFAVLCLGLSVLVLHRQITAHPAPPVAASPTETPEQAEQFIPTQPIHPKTAHIATGAERRAATTAVGNQLAAIRTGNADAAWFYQSRALHNNFTSAQAFVETISRSYPEFGHSQSVAFGPVWMDPSGDHAAVIVTVRGQNGRLARGYYQLIREDGGYKVAGVAGGRAVN